MTGLFPAAILFAPGYVATFVPAMAAAPQLPTAYYPGPMPTSPLGPEPGVVVVVVPPTRKPRRQAQLLRAIVMAAVILLVIILAVRVSGQRERGRKRAMRSLSARLAHRGWTLYLMKGCGFCEKQMRELGRYPRYVVLSADPSHQILDGNGPVLLDVREIPAFPYWYREEGQNRESRTGYQNWAALETMAR